MDNKRYEIFLGALLHDIGKFWQRADEKIEKSELSDQSKKNIEYICPQNQKNYFGYQHVLWTNEFFNLFEKKFRELGLTVNPFDAEADKEDHLINFAIYHHKPNSELQALIQMADWWSSGIDREKDYDGFAKENNYSNFKNVSLMSIWEQINSKDKKFIGEYGYKLKPLSIDDKTIFPEKLNEINQTSDDYKKLWTGFIEEFEKIKTDDIAAFTETLLYLLKKYTWCIPASTMKGDLPASSLYEHLKSTAALAHCFYTFKEKHSEAFCFDEQQKRLTLNLDKFPVLLFCGDISGIQSFIYNITSKKAAVSLKGRSFFVQLLTDAVIQRIIKDCDVTQGHIVYASGGKFYILLPNTDDVKIALENIESKILNGLYGKGYGDLYVCMDYIPFRYDFEEGNGFINYLDNEGKNLGELWTSLLDKVAQKKNQKFRTELIDKFDGFFNATGTGTTDVCSITGLEGKLVNLPKDDKTKVLKSVLEQIQLGEALKEAKYLITSINGNIREYHNFEPLSLGVNYALIHKGQTKYADNAWVRHINEVSFDDDIKGNNLAKGFLVYGGNKQAYNNKGEYLTFDKLAGSEDDGFRKLGVLRMDVDNLGSIFSDGIKNKTLAGYATLSGFLDLFFSGYLNKIREKYEDTINIIYSGGDDVFAVGKWDDIITFAYEVRNEFRAFVCNREDISISAGIAIVGGKFPIAKAAILSGEAEDKAKKFGEDKEKNIKAHKNAFCILGEAVDWKEEFDFISVFSQELYEWLDADLISKGMIQKFFIYRNMIKHGKLDWRWLSAYSFARYEKDKSKGKEQMTILKEFFLTGKYKNYHFKTARAVELLCISARIAEFKLRY